MRLTRENARARVFQIHFCLSFWASLAAVSSSSRSRSLHTTKARLPAQEAGRRQSVSILLNIVIRRIAAAATLRGETGKVRLAAASGQRQSMRLCMLPFIKDRVVHLGGIAPLQSSYFIGAGLAMAAQRQQVRRIRAASRFLRRDQLRATVGLARSGRRGFEAAALPHRWECVARMMED